MVDYGLRSLSRSLSQHLPYVVVALLILTAGIVTGVVQLLRLDGSQQAQVGQYLDYLVQSATGQAAVRGDQAGNGAPPHSPAWPAAAEDALRQVAIAWAAGGFIVALPVTWGMLFLHGYSLGFAVGAMAAHWQWWGLLLAVAAIFPANALQIPALLLVAAAATRLAGVVAVRRLRRGLPTFSSPWLAYVAWGVVAAGLALGASLLETYVTPFLTALVSRWLT